MSDPRELIGLLAAGCPDLESAGATSVRGDARQMLAGAMAAIRPAWAADLLLARYADDMGARNRAVHGAMVEAAHWYPWRLIGVGLHKRGKHHNCLVLFVIWVCRLVVGVS